MKALKSHIQLTAFVLSFVFTNTVLAAESPTNESKDSGTSNAISNTDSETASSVAQSESINDAQSYRKQMDERRQQAQVAQQEAYNRFLERRKQYTAEFNNNIPADGQERHNEFMKQMEQRRALNISENKDNRADNTTSNADLTNNAASDTTSPVAQNADSETALSVAQAETINDTQSYRKQMDEHRLQVQEAQLEAYKSFLERRKQFTAEFNNNIPADVQERRNEYIKQMEQRRALNTKMMEQYRKAAAERREAWQLEMKKTNTESEPKPEIENKA